jgi:hypothetical protein
MRIVAALIKNGEVMDTYTRHVPTQDHLGEAAKPARDAAETLRSSPILLAALHG